MQIVPFETLYHSDFIISEPLAKPQNWYARGNVYNALGNPKVSHTLLWFKNCSATIQSKSGALLEVEKGQLTYMAKDSEYAVYFHDTAPNRTDSIVLHFQMRNAQGEDIAPITEPVLCLRHLDATLGLAVEAAAAEFRKSVVCLPEIAAVIYRLLAETCRFARRQNTRSRFSCIQNGIELLEQDSDLKIADIAAACGVSECYFRRLFRAYSGESPMDFRQRHRIEKAKQLLLSDDLLTTENIAAELHFSDVYHFSKTFKKLTGVSPRHFAEHAAENK